MQQSTKERDGRPINGVDASKPGSGDRSKRHQHEVANWDHGHEETAPKDTDKGDMLGVKKSQLNKHRPRRPLVARTPSSEIEITAQTTPTFPQTQPSQRSET